MRNPAVRAGRHTAVRRAGHLPGHELAVPIRQHPLQRAAGRCGHRAFCGQQGRQRRHALAETINGLYKTELIHRRAPWKSKEAVELATLEWVSWFNHRRLMESPSATSRRPKPRPPAATAPAMAACAPHVAGVTAATFNAARQTRAAFGVAVFGALLMAMPSFHAGMRAALWTATCVSLAASLALKAP